MYDLTANIAEARASLEEKPLFATTAELFLILDEIKSAYPELPQPLRFAKLFSILLSRVSVPLEAHDLIAGRCVDRELSDEEEARFQAYLPERERLCHTCMLGMGHCEYSWGHLLERGLCGLRAEAERGLEQAPDEDHRTFLLGAIGIYDAISAYLCRYAAAAEEKGLHAMAARLRHLAVAPPNDFASALQLHWIVAFLNCAYITRNPTLTLGRMDQILYRFYRDDLAAGRLTREEAAAYITDYYCKHNLIMGRGEHQVGDETNSTTFNRIYCFDAPQYLLLAGTDEAGAPAVNELTELFAACIVPAFKNPVVVVRYVPGMDTAYPRLWKTLTGKALESASLMFYNDRNVLDTYARIGLPEADARRYSHFGCNWPSPGDHGAWMNGTISSARYNEFVSEEERAALKIPFLRTNTPHGWPEDFLEVLRELAARPKGSVTIEDFYTAFLARVQGFIDYKLFCLSRELGVRRRRPAKLIAFGDCFLADSLRLAESCAASAKYHFGFLSFQMFGTVADCFIAVDQLVMREQKLTLGELLAAVEADFVGYEEVWALCRKAEKYGMDTPLSNAHARRLSREVTTRVIESSRPYLAREGLFLTPCMQSDTWHLKMGEDFGATPDGRRAHTPFSQNTRPSNGACTNGLSAMLNAMLELPHDGLLSGALNLDVDKRQFKGEEGHARFAALLGDYFNRGGLHAQVSSLGVDELLDAREHPDAHRDLRVRVTGYTGIFVDMCDRLQNDIVERLK